MPEYKALVFDFFGVICSEVAPFWFQEHFGEKGVELKEQYFPAADRGSVSQDALLGELSQIANISPRAIEDDWFGRAHFNTETIALLRKLRSAPYKIGLLTNAVTPFVREVLALSGTAGLYDEIIVSSEVGLTKPEPEIYKLMLAKLGIAPEEALMIDDSPANIAGAEVVGMHGHLFTSATELRKVLS